MSGAVVSTSIARVCVVTVAWSAARSPASLVSTALTVPNRSATCSVTLLLSTPARSAGCASVVTNTRTGWPARRHRAAPWVNSSRIKIVKQQLSNKPLKYGNVNKFVRPDKIKPFGLKKFAYGK